jgi:sarcosine oxidase subunit gamma
MAEFALKPRTGFEGLAIPGRYATAAGAEPQIIIAVRPNLIVAQLSAFRGKQGDVAKAVLEITGLDLPDGPKRAAVGGLALIGMAPAQWLAIADGAEGRAVLSRLSAALSGLASIVDQSDAKAILRVSGPRLRDTLAKGCALYLHPRVFGLEDAATTQIALIPCQLWQLDEAPTFELAVPLSYSRSFWSWLTASAAEFGYEIRNQSSAG